MPPAPAVPEGVPDNAGVYVLRLTGEVFSDYDAFLARLAFYEARSWTCSVTGTGNLTYEEALTSEQEARELLAQCEFGHGLSRASLAFHKLLLKASLYRSPFGANHAPLSLLP